MDQYNFEFNINIVGLDVDAFIESIRKLGYEKQSDTIKEQFNKQIDELM